MPVSSPRTPPRWCAIVGTSQPARTRWDGFRLRGGCLEPMWCSTAPSRVSPSPCATAARTVRFRWLEGSSGDRLICGYHGMEFGPDGVCAHMPALSNAPSTVAVRTYPTADRGPLTWIWMGSPDLADEALIPDTAWLSSPDWGTVTGGFQIKSDYVAMHENLIDQTHFPFLHPETVGTPEYARSKLAVSTSKDQVTIRRELRNSPPPGVYGKPAQIMHKRVDRFSEAWFISPAMHVAFAQIVDPAPDLGKPGRYRYNITHLFTPETNTSIHYWWFNSRDYKPGDSAIDAFLLETSAQAYREDLVALEWIMDVVRNDADPQIDLSFAPDKPGLMARRIMYRLAMKEISTINNH
jgi:phenylpropionate dioxygenase-like ring-hydroxylating dioxygenase large terminal subunit